MTNNNRKNTSGIVAMQFGGALICEASSMNKMLPGNILDQDMENL
jgi:hypothetical protein